MPCSPGSCTLARIVPADGAVRPVLKHGPRSLTWVRVFGWQTPTRREIEMKPEPHETGRMAGSALFF